MEEDVCCLQIKATFRVTLINSMNWEEWERYVSSAGALCEPKITKNHQNHLPCITGRAAQHPTLSRCGLALAPWSCFHAQDGYHRNALETPCKQLNLSQIVLLNHQQTPGEQLMGR